MLHVLFALNCIAHVGVWLEVRELIDIVAFRMPFDCSLLMLSDTTQ